MGNLCSNDYSNVSDQNFKCIKCNDTVSIYKNNTRKHCRIHSVGQNDICIDCNMCITKKYRINCNHIGEKNWYDFLFN